MGNASEIIRRRIAMLQKLLARELNHRCRILHEEAIRHLSEVLVEIEEDTQIAELEAEVRNG